MYTVIFFHWEKVNFFSKKKQISVRNPNQSKYQIFSRILWRVGIILVFKKTWGKSLLTLPKCAIDKLT